MTAGKTERPVSTANTVRGVGDANALGTCGEMTESPDVGKEAHGPEAERVGRVMFD